MQDTPLTIREYPQAIIHIDGDAFFASCEQAANPKLKGKPVVTGKERGIAASMSYEAKAQGVTRGMRVSDIKKVCPDAIILPSDYETYSLLSKRFFSIVRRYTPEVEEYSIDECFADLTGMRRPFHMSYEKIAEKIKHDLDNELGFTFSVGLSLNKIMAKVASKWMKPSGLTAIPGYRIHLYLQELAAEKIWGIGSQTSAYLRKHGINTALEFATQTEEWIKSHLTKPHYEIWQELNGKYVYKLTTQEKTTYASIQKVKTFSPPSKDPSFVFSQLSKNIENACIKARRHRLAAQGAIFLLRTQGFMDTGIETKFSHPTAIPSEIIGILQEHFNELFIPTHLYRQTGVVLTKLTDKIPKQDLFGEVARAIEMKKLYEVIDKVNTKYGKHKIYLASSFLANKTAQHDGERGMLPERKSIVFKGETKRKRLGIPAFLGEVK